MNLKKRNEKLPQIETPPEKWGWSLKASQFPRNLVFKAYCEIKAKRLAYSTGGITRITSEIHRLLNENNDILLWTDKYLTGFIWILWVLTSFVWNIIICIGTYIVHRNTKHLSQQHKKLNKHKMPTIEKMKNTVQKAHHWTLKKLVGCGPVVGR